jgi:hypothetical protein
MIVERKRIELIFEFGVNPQGTYAGWCERLRFFEGPLWENRLTVRSIDAHDFYLPESK